MIRNLDWNKKNEPPKKKHVIVENSTKEAPENLELITHSRNHHFFCVFFLMVFVNGGMNLIGCCQAQILLECFMGLFSVGCHANVEKYTQMNTSIHL